MISLGYRHPQTGKTRWSEPYVLYFAIREEYKCVAALYVRKQATALGGSQEHPFCQDCLEGSATPPGHRSIRSA